MRLMMLERNTGGSVLLGRPGRLFSGAASTSGSESSASSGVGAGSGATEGPDSSAMGGSSVSIAKLGCGFSDSGDVCKFFFDDLTTFEILYSAVNTQHGVC